ncbi:MAG: PEP-CTERM sorting domain-containing protein [Burkholderiales bacterium]|nr:PEP-CTERM sorting domain-containing protein [Burkholderiales bacterium]
MKLHRQILAAAAIGLFSASALATIQNSENGNGELFWTIIDPVAERSYTRDLGVTIDQFLAGVASGQSWSVGADAALTSFIAGTAAGNLATLVWSIGAMDSVGPNRFISTGEDVSRNSATPATATSGLLGIQTTQLRQFDDNANIYLAQANLLGTHPTVDHGSNIATSADGDAYGGAAVYGTNWGGRANWDNSVEVIGGVSKLWLLEQGTNTTTSPARFTQLLYAGNAYTAQWDGTALQIQAIPEPGTYAMLGAGLLVVGALARRRSNRA